jgi:hypothetical protein
LVKREDVLRAMDLMASLGYTAQSRFTKSQMTAYLAAHNEISFVNEERKVIVELQWEIALATLVFRLPICVCGTVIS